MEEIPYIPFGVAKDAVTHALPRVLDGLSQPIHVPFPLGSHLESTVYVRLLNYAMHKVCDMVCNVCGPTKCYVTCLNLTVLFKICFRDYSSVRRHSQLPEETFITSHFQSLKASMFVCIFAPLLWNTSIKIIS